jgi:3-dehydroquinate dehydratase
MPPQRWGGYSLLLVTPAFGEGATIRNIKQGGKQMDDFLSEVQSDELAACADFQDWIDLNRLEAIDALDKEMENCND